MTASMFDSRDMDMVHRMLRREFALMPALVRDVADGDEGRAGEVDAHIDLLTTLLHHHHHCEDEFVWPLLRERCPGAVNSLVRVMGSQHETVATLGTLVGYARNTWQDGALAEDREALAETLDRLVWALEGHLATEEQQHIVPLMEQHIGSDEWNVLAQRAGADIDVSLLPLCFGLLMYEADPEILETAITTVPPDAQPGIREVAASAFAAYSEKIHGTATPPRSWQL